MQTVHAHRVLSMEDEGSVKYIEYAQAHPAAQQVSAQGTSSQNAPGNGSSRLIGALGGDGSASDNTASGASPSGPQPGSNKGAADIIIAGNRLAIAEKTKELLKTMAPIEIINNVFIPALDRVGELYEQGKIFLPQLMSSAETAKRGFDILKEGRPAGSSSSHMKIVLATVKGDIHDIGKNIVKMLLENYGYEVIDLGKDVDPSAIVQTVKEQNIRLVGLSALMTTTVHNMEETIAVLRRECPSCKIMVGGAVLSAQLAEKIGADYYAKDAAGSAKIAAEVEAAAE